MQIKILIKNAFRIATHTLLTVKVRFDHGLDSREAIDLVQTEIYLLKVGGKTFVEGISFI